ncbi:MAG: dTDP-4-dehydrorhamnose reductase [Pseudomonadota bacterium]
MKFLVFGQSGQVARELARLAPAATYLDPEAADLRDPATCAAWVERAEADAVINAAAWTNVDGAEDNPDEAFVVNADAPGAMAMAAAARGLPFVQISTDYVFDGSGTDPWKPESDTGPKSVYGASKRAGETAVRAAGGPHAIVRGSWIFSSYGRNFVKTMLHHADTRDRLTVVDDQIGGPTPAADMAAACIRMAEALAEDPALTGTYHYSGAPDVSWADFAREIMDQAGRSVEIDGIKTADYPTRAQRPLNSRLDCSATESAFGLMRPDWRSGLSLVLASLDTP